MPPTGVAGSRSSSPATDGGGRAAGDDDDLLVPLIRAKRILEVLRAPTDRQPRWDLQLANLEAYQALG